MAAIEVLWPPMLHANNGTPNATTSTFTLNTTSTTAVTGFGWVFRVKENVTITSASFLVVSVTVTAPGTLTGGLKAVTTTTGGGLVTADTTTWLGANTAFGTTSTYAANTWTTITFGTPYTAQRGDVIGFWIQPTSGTWDATHSINILRAYQNVSHLTRAPYAVAANGSTTVGKQAVNSSSFMYHSSTKSYGWPFSLGNDIGAAINSGSTPNEIGLKFRLPASSCSSYSVAGVMVSGLLGTGDWDLVLYDSNGTTELQNITIDKDQIYNASSYPHIIYFNETTLASLSPNVYYRVTLRPTSGTNMGTTHYWTLRANDRSCLVDQAADISWTERTGGAWTDTTTQLLVMQLIITDITGSAGSTLAANPLAGYVA